MTQDGIWQPLPALARELGISARTLYRRIGAGAVEVITVGGQRLGRPVVRVTEPLAQPGAGEGGEPCQTATDGTAGGGAPSQSVTTAAGEALAIVAAELASAREAAAAERARADRLALVAMELVALPWYAVRARGRLRAELMSAAVYRLGA